jgi:hypothetical protein
MLSRPKLQQDEKLSVHVNEFADLQFVLSFCQNCLIQNSELSKHAEWKIHVLQSACQRQSCKHELNLHILDLLWTVY